MEISGVKPIEPSVNQQVVKNIDNSPATGKADLENNNSNSQKTEAGKGKQELSKEELRKVNDELNNFMSVIDSGLQFSIHEKTKQLMVQVINTKDNKVLKEFPSHEMLDMIAKIREYVGVLLDKKV